MSSTLSGHSPHQFLGFDGLLDSCLTGIPRSQYTTNIWVRIKPMVVAYRTVARRPTATTSTYREDMGAHIPPNYTFDTARPSSSNETNNDGGVHKRFDNIRLCLVAVAVRIVFTLLPSVRRPPSTIPRFGRLCPQLDSPVAAYASHRSWPRS
ncbi:hypothetical protein BC629DRAFT_1595488 [Irpex lacteus]|nr:hypothetical protein BC629DRAFT_1595488 [Irpex lacteus]